MTELDRRGFLHLSLGAALLPIIPSLALERYEPESFGRLVIEYTTGGRDMTVGFALTEAQMFGDGITEPMEMTADRACTVTGFRAELSIGGHIKSADLVRSHAGRTWSMDVGDTITVMPPDGGPLCVMT